MAVHPFPSRKTDRTRASIIDAAKRFFRMKGYAGTTMADVARSVSLSERTVFTYFPAKHFLLQAALENDNAASLARMNERAERSTADPVDYLVELIDGEMEYDNLIDSLDLWRELAAANILSTNSIKMAAEIRQYRANLFEHLRRGVERLVADGRLQPDAPVHELTQSGFEIAFLNFHQLLTRNYADEVEARADMTKRVAFVIRPYLAR